MNCRNNIYAFDFLHTIIVTIINAASSIYPPIIPNSDIAPVIELNSKKPTPIVLVEINRKIVATIIIIDRNTHIAISIHFTAFFIITLLNLKNNCELRIGLRLRITNCNQFLPPVITLCTGFISFLIIILTKMHAAIIVKGRKIYRIRWLSGDAFCTSPI